MLHNAPTFGFHINRTGPLWKEQFWPEHLPDFIAHGSGGERSSCTRLEHRSDLGQYSKYRRLRRTSPVRGRSICPSSRRPGPPTCPQSPR